MIKLVHPQLLSPYEREAPFKCLKRGHPFACLFSLRIVHRGLISAPTFSLPSVFCMMPPPVDKSIPQELIDRIRATVRLKRIFRNIAMPKCDHEVHLAESFTIYLRCNLKTIVNGKEYVFDEKERVVLSEGA